MTGVELHDGDLGRAAWITRPDWPARVIVHGAGGTVAVSVGGLAIPVDRTPDQIEDERYPFSARLRWGATVLLGVTAGQWEAACAWVCDGHLPADIDVRKQTTPL